MPVTGLLTPDARLRVFSDLGVVLPGAKLNTYVAGSPSTPLAAYTDAALTTPHANPIVASAAGLFAAIYLTPGVAYKLVLTTSADVVVWTADPVMMPTNNSLAAGAGITLSTVAGVTTITSSAAAGVASISANDFRLTLETGVAVSSADQLAKTSIFCTPKTGNRIDLYDAAGLPTTIISAQFTIALPAVASQVYDVFAFNNAGVATLELLAWTNDTTRATALVQTTTGSYTKTGDLTRRYLGTVRTTAVAGQTEDSLAKRYLWNYYHRVPRTLRVTEATDSWTYTLATLRQANAAAGNQIDVVIGIAEVPIEIDVQAFATCTAAGGATQVALVAIGEDSTTTMKAGTITNPFSLNSGNFQTMTARLKTMPAVGRHFYTWLEYSDAVGTTTWRGDNGAPTIEQAGIQAVLQG